MTTRTGSLLLADSLDRYQPLGAFGQPVYLSHVQLRAAVRQKLGARYANYFSRPDRDPQTRSIRWLSDLPGAAVRWRDLPPGEQVVAALDLQDMRSAFQKYLEDLRPAQGAPRETAAFASLLENALLVPDDEHLFFVNGQPMVSFWGFRHGEGSGFDALTVAPSPLASAAPASPAPAPTAPIAPSVAGAGWPWWWWLAGLLALLALLALLWFSWNGWRWPGGWPNLPGLSLERSVPATPPPLSVTPEKTVIPPDRAAIVPTLPGAPSVLAPLSPVVPSGPGGIVVPLVPETTVVPSKPSPTDVPPAPPTVQTPPPKVEVVPLDPPVVKPLPLPDTALRSPVPGQEQPGLVIPSDGQKGGLAFLDGWWRSGSGLVNRKDNAPLQQFYRFDRAGKGEVVIRRADGSECRAPAQASFSGNGLDVTELADPHCPDGTSIERSRTVCRRDETGKTVCFGVNNDNSTYRVPVERVP